MARAFCRRRMVARSVSALVSHPSKNQGQVEPAFRLRFAFLIGAQSDSPFMAHLLRSGLGPAGL
jgi:hypothetical protein